jgi:hypothetical protein
MHIHDLLIMWSVQRDENFVRLDSLFDQSLFSRCEGQT